MCKEDVRIKRKTDRNIYDASQLTASWSVIFPPRPDRVALIIVNGDPQLPIASQTYLAIGIPNGGTPLAIAAVNPTFATMVLTIETCGIVITDQIWGISSRHPTIGSVIEVFFDQQLGEI